MLPKDAVLACSTYNYIAHHSHTCLFVFESYPYYIASDCVSPTAFDVSGATSMHSFCALEACLKQTEAYISSESKTATEPSKMYGHYDSFKMAATYSSCCISDSADYQ